MNEDVNEMEPGCDISPAWEGKPVETDEKEVTVNSDRKAVSSDGKDDFVTQLLQDFIAPTAKKKELYVSEKHPFEEMKYVGFKSGVRPLDPLSKRKFMTNIIDRCVEDGDFRSTLPSKATLNTPANVRKRARNVKVSLGISETTYKGKFHISTAIPQTPLNSQYGTAVKS